MKRRRSNLLNNGMELFTGKKINGALVRVVACTLNMELRDAACKAAEKQHVPFALEVLKDINRIVDGMDTNSSVLSTMGNVLPDLRILGRIFNGIINGYFSWDLPLASMVHRLVVSHALPLYCRNLLGQPFMNAGLYTHLQRTF